MAKKKSKANPFIRKGMTPTVTTTSTPSGGLWLYLQDGEITDVVPLVHPDEIISYREHYLYRGKGVPSPRFACINGGPEECPGCELGDKPRFRAFVPVVQLIDGEWEQKIFPIGKLLNDQWFDLAEMLGKDDFVGAQFAVKRTGKQLKTKYSIMAKGKTTDVTDYVDEIPDILSLIGPFTRDEILQKVNDLEAEVSESTGETDAAKIRREIDSL